MLLFIEINAELSILEQYPGQWWIAEFVTVLMIFFESSVAYVKSKAPRIVFA